MSAYCGIPNIDRWTNKSINGLLTIKRLPNTGLNFHSHIKVLYPSIKNPVGFWTFAIAAAKSSRTTSLLTRPPFFMISESSVPFAEPDWTSALNKSPVDKWAKLYFLTMRSHWVPFPQPGPPKTQMMGTFESITCKNKMFVEILRTTIKIVFCLAKKCLFVQDVNLTKWNAS